MGELSRVKCMVVRYSRMTNATDEPNAARFEIAGFHAPRVCMYSGTQTGLSAGLGWLCLFSIHEIRILTKVFGKNYYWKCLSHFMNKEYA
jgi:hypothetical protein